mgnify:CR=1 FL=1
MQKKRKSAEDSALFDNVASEKLKFPLYIFPDTMEKVNMLYEICLLYTSDAADE